MRSHQIQTQTCRIPTSQYQLFEWANWLNPNLSIGQTPRISTRRMDEIAESYLTLPSLTQAAPQAFFHFPARRVSKGETYLGRGAGWVRLGQVLKLWNKNSPVCWVHPVYSFDEVWFSELWFNKLVSASWDFTSLDLATSHNILWVLFLFPSVLWFAFPHSERALLCLPFLHAFTCVDHIISIILSQL